MTTTKAFRCRIKGAISFRRVYIFAESQADAIKHAAMFFKIEPSAIEAEREWGYS